MTPTNRAQRTSSTELVPQRKWFKSSYSTQDNGNCVEVADLSGLVGIRDSKDKGRPALVVPTALWAEFIDDVQAGRYGSGLVD